MALTWYPGGANAAQILALRPWRADTGVPALHLQPLGDATWLPQPGDATARLADKAQLIAAGEPVYACLPGSAAAAAEAAAAVYPDAAAQAEPLRAAGLAVCDDLCVMQRREHAWCLAAGMLCQPSYWCLADKLDRSLHEIHAPVPNLNRRIGARITAFFDRLPAGRTFVRSNWFVHASGQLYQPRIDDPWPQTVAALSACLHLRCERQTLTRLPVSNAILFTILALTAPLLTVAADASARAELLQAARRLPAGHPKAAHLAQWCNLLRDTGLRPT